MSDLKFEKEINLNPEVLSLKSVSLWQITWRRFFKRKSALVGLTILGILVFISLTAQWIAPYSPYQVLIGVESVKRREKPCIHLLGCPAEKPQHIMGTDGNVRDQFSRMLYGARLSLIIGLSTVSFAIIIVSIPAYARVVRASVLSVREMDYVSATRALGGSDFNIIFKRILPNALTPLIVQGTLGIATAILEAAALSFLGLGAQPPTPEWGSMLGAERNQVFTAPHLVFYPGLAIMLTVLAFNLLGDGLRDALDPRLAHVSG